MFASTAQAQTPGGAPAAGAGPDLISVLGLPLVLVALFYFMIIRPQAARQKKQADTLSKIKRGDTVVMSSGIIGKVLRVDDAELGVEIAPTVTVKVVKSMITEVRAKGEPAPANDAKA
jgi:preprotein translocase subunit YajC